MPTDSNLVYRVDDDTPSRALRFDEIEVGQAVVQRVVFDAEALDHFRHLAKDRAPVHEDARFARTAGFEDRIVQGLAVSTRFSRLIGMYLPGERAILGSIELAYHRPVYAGRELEYQCTVERLLPPMRVVQMSLSVSMDALTHVSGRCRCVVR
jgi:3-hydroxybutyryl-CoA dehydratase